MFRRTGPESQHGRVRVGLIAAFAASTLVGGAFLAHQGFALDGVSTPALGTGALTNGVSSVAAPSTSTVTGTAAGTAKTSSSTSTTSSTASCTSTGQAADKAFVSGSTLTAVSPFTNQQLLCVQMRTSTPEDLMLGVTTECSILTQVSTTGSSSSSASGTIDIWVTVDGHVVPVDTTQPANQTTNGQVTFCNRDATQNFTDGDATSSGQDTLTEYLKTKTANAFNWANLDTGNGIHTVQVWATFIPGSSCSDTTPAPSSTTANCTGEIGNRTLEIQPTKFAQ